MKTFWVIVLYFLSSSSNLVHQDTPLQIDENGDIIGLPKEFSPAEFNVEKKHLRIGNTEVEFPNCLNDYFNNHEEPELNLSASWYHSKDIMPYYLSFNVSQKDIDYGYTVLVNLETLELIYVSKSIKEGNTVYSPIIELKEECLTEYRKRIKIVE